MKSEPTEIGIPRSPAGSPRRPFRPAVPHAHPGTDATPGDMDRVSPAAMDEVFTMLARNVERMQQSNGRVCQTASHSAPDATSAVQPAGSTRADLGSIPSMHHSHRAASMDTVTLRSLDAEMDIQHERLAQLLRDIEGPAASD